MPDDATLVWQSPQFQVDLTPVDVTLQFNAAGAGPEGPPGAVGPKGDKGDPGQSITGPQGLPGQAATVAIGSTVTLAPGSPAQVNNTGTPQAGVFNFGVPAGVAGQPATIAVGTTGTGAPGTPAQVTDSGSPSAAILNFVIPAGVAGANGATGPQGPPGVGINMKGTVPTSSALPPTGNQPNDCYTALDTGHGWVWNGTTWIDIGPIQGPAGTPGAPGAPGVAATITVGTTTTGAPGTNANVVQSGTPQAATLSFTIPAGVAGAAGAAGAAATVAAGTTNTLPPGSAATVTNSGTAAAAVFNFGIPAGQTGAAGAQGPPGPGDMTKAQYDQNNDGVCDHAALADTASAVPWTGVTGKPASFPPSAHAPTHNLGGSDAIAPDWTQVQNKPGTFPPSAHAASHVTGGSDIIPIANQSRVGLLNQLSGNNTDFVDGTNACQNLVTAIQPTIWSARLRNFNSVGNPNAEVCQRNVGALLTNPANLSWLEDRWQFLNTGFSMTVGRTGTGAWPNSGITVPGTSFALSNAFFRVTLTTAKPSLAATDSMGFRQTIEGNVFRELSADVHSVSILARSSVPNLSFGLVLSDNPVTRSLSKLCTLGAANTLTLIQLPALPSWPGAGNFSIASGVPGYLLQIILCAGSSNIPPANDAWQTAYFAGAVGQSNFAASTAGATFDLCFVQHSPGPDAGAISLIDEPFQQNLEKCQRYYDKSYFYTTPIGTTTVTGAPSLFGLSGWSNVWGFTPFKKRMAKNPTVAAYNPNTGAANSVRMIGTSTDMTVTSVSNADVGISAVNFSAGIAATGLGQFQYVADCGW